MGKKRNGAIAAVMAPAGVILVLLLVAGVCVQQCEALNLFTGKDLSEHEGKLDGRESSHADDQLDDFDDDLLEEEEEDEIEEEEEERGWGGLEDFEGVDFVDDFEDEEGLGVGEGEREEDEENVVVDETDVVVLGNENFSDFVNSNQYVLVEFYAPWCGHCQQLAPEFAAAATELKGEAALAKVDATAHDDLAREFDVESYPTLFFFINGVLKKFTGQRSKDDIVEWVKKKTGPPVTNLNSKEDAETVVDLQKDTVAIALLTSFEGSDVEELISAARLEESVLFFQTDSAEVAAVFNFPEDVKRPALVLLKPLPDKVTWFDGLFKREAIGTFVTENKSPLVIPFNEANKPLIFESAVKKQVILFAGVDDFEKVGPNFKEASRLLKGKLIFVHVDLDDSEQASGLMTYFGISGDEASVMAYEAKDNGKKYMLDGDITTENVKVFGESFLSDSLKPFHKSAPIPETNNEDVKVVVGLNLDGIVLDETKDVFLEIYAPWCGHCQALEPTWDKLAKRLKEVDSIVIAKTDGTANEHERAKSDGFPTLLFYPAGKKSFDPITYDGDRTVKDFVTFLKQEASIPFKMPKKRNNQTKTNNSETTKPGLQSVVQDPLQSTKDEL